MTTCVESPKSPAKQPLELTSKFIKVTGYKANIQKSVVSLCASSKQLGNEI